MRKANQEERILALGAGILLILAMGLFLWWSSPQPASHPVLSTSPVAKGQPSAGPELALPNAEEVTADHYDREILPGLTRATLVGLLSAPRWVTFPNSVTVHLNPQPGNPAKAQQASSSGGNRQIHFPHVPLGNWRLVMDPEGFEKVEMVLTISARDLSPRVVLPLQEARYLRGTVHDADGNPLEGMVVHAEPLEPVKGFSIRRSRALTLADGSFAIKGLPANAYRVQCGEYSFPLGEAQELQLLGKEGWVELIAPGLGTLQATLSDEKTNHPVNKGQVMVQRVGGEGNLGHAARQTIGKDGTVHFRHLPPGEYSLTIFSRIWHRRVQRCHIQVGQTTQLEISLKAMN